MRLNINITHPKIFRFSGGQTEIEGAMQRPIEMLRAVTGIIENGVLIELDAPEVIAEVHGNRLLLLPESEDGVRNLIKGHSIWAEVMLVDDRAKEENGIWRSNLMVLIGRAMIVMIKR